MASALRSCISFLLLSHYNNAQHDMLHRISILKDAQRSCPDFVSVVGMFKTLEIIPSSFHLQDRVLSQIEQCCRDASVVSLVVDTGSGDVEMEPSPVPIVASAIVTETSAQCASALHNRVVEHNIRVISTYYTQIRTSRIAELLNLSVDALEVHLAEMSHGVSSISQSSIEDGAGSKATVTEDEQNGNGGTVLYIRINRPAGIVCFEKPHSAESTLSEWAGGISDLLSLMETTCHLINRENMVHKV